MMLGDNGKILQVVFTVVVHRVGVAHGAIMYVASSEWFCCVVVLEMPVASEAEDDFRIGIM